MNMNIDDIEIKIKSYDRKKNFVIVNLTILDVFEIRGFTVRYLTTKHSPTYPVWIVTPPSVKGRNKMFFHVIRVLDSALWQQLEKRIIEMAKEYTNT